MVKSGLTTKIRRVTIAPPLGQMSYTAVYLHQASYLIPMLSDHSREADDLDYLLRDALWSSSNVAPDSARAWVALRTRIESQRQLGCKPHVIQLSVRDAASASCWYFMPLLRILR
jgi:hypothetical protein